MTTFEKVNLISHFWSPTKS